ncbi:MAG: ABC transporter substrate-binding protein [Actinomycetota bacterium]|nr:ABC transporter substrate-binding protein [Actinomycetota bacterium]
MRAGAASSGVGAALSRRGFLSAAAVTGAGALLAGCGGGQSAQEAATGTGQEFTGTYEGPQVDLAYWNGFTGGDGPFMREMVNKFNSDHDNIKVTMNTIQWADYYQKVPAAVLAGKGPDVGIMHVEQLATFAVRNIILPLDDLTEEVQLQENDFIPAIWQAGVYNEKRYGVPLDVHSLAQYYNSDLISKGGQDTPPEDDPAFSQYLTKLNGAGAAQPFWMPTRWPAHLMFLSLLWQFGGEPYSEDGTRATFDSEAGQQALSWMVDRVKQGHSPRNVGVDTQYTAFKNGKVAVTWDGIWQINDLKSTAANLNWDMSPLPKIGEDNAVWANSHNFVLYKQTQGDDNKTQAAKMFIAEISQASSEWAKSGMIPARNSERNGDAFKQLPQAKIAAQEDSFRFLPQIPGVGDVQVQTLELAVNRAVLGQQSPKDALTSAATQASKLMQANKKKFEG